MFFSLKQCSESWPNKLKQNVKSVQRLFMPMVEQQAAKTLAEAAEIMQSQPVSLQLRYLQTLVEMAGEKNSTIIPLTLDIVNTLSQFTTKGIGK